MLTLEFVNYVLSLIGEQPLATSAGNLGTLARNAIYTSLLTTVQFTRANFFEKLLSGQVTNEDYLVPAFKLPDETTQVLNVWLVDPITDTMVPLKQQELSLQSIPSFTYDIIGNQLFLNKGITRPAQLTIKALVIPTLPASDTDDIGFPSPIRSAVAHGAASILCLSYVDDGNAAAQHKRLAEEAMLMLRQQFGITRGRQFNFSNLREFYA